MLKNRKAINITLPLDLIDKAKEKAKADNRKLAKFILFEVKLDKVLDDCEQKREKNENRRVEILHKIMQKNRIKNFCRFR